MNLFNKKDEIISQGIVTSTILAEGLTIKDNEMSGEGNVRIGGIFIGNVDINGLLIIEDSGNVKGNIISKVIIIEGSVEGNVTSSSSIHICKNGIIIGNLQCISLIIDEGAYFRGTCLMGDRTSSNPI